MAPETTTRPNIPLNFGLRLLQSPTHSNLTLEARRGEVVRASSVILSLNSPVIDHMTTDLHLNTLDVKEFSKEAVQLFVDAAYTGAAVTLSRKTFRDVHKMANVFEVEWLVTKCEEQFSGLAALILEPSFADLLFLFEEAAFVCKYKLKSMMVKDLAIEKIKSFKWEQQFIVKYLESGSSFSTQQLDVLIELAGPKVHYLVQPITENLTSQVAAGTALFPHHVKYLLDTCDLGYYHQHSGEQFEKLFDLLREMLGESPQHYKWMIDLYRASYKQERVSSLVKGFTQSGSPNKAGNVRRTTASKSKQKEPVIKEVLLKKLNKLDCSLEFEDFIDWMGKSLDVKNLMMFLEGLMAWMDTNPKLVPDRMEPTVLEKIVAIKHSRDWKPIPLSFFEFISVLLKDQSSSFVSIFKRLMRCQDIVTKDLDQWHEETVMLDENRDDVKGMLQKNVGKYYVEFKPSGVKDCSLPGECGFILKSAWNEKTGMEISLSTDPEDYPKDLHFHPEVQAENIYVQPVVVFWNPMTWHTVPGPNVMQYGSVSVISMNVFIAK